jgi:hypothetical protein
LSYTSIERIFKAELNHPDLTDQILQACGFISNTAFNLDHWFFVFSYLVISYRVELTARGITDDSYNCSLNAVNILVCLFNVVIHSIFCLYFIKGEYKTAGILTDVEQLSLVLSCIVLASGIFRLVRIVKSLVEKMVNKTMISMHIVAYLFIVVADVIQILYAGLVKSQGWGGVEISTICFLFVYSVCSLIFGLLVNAILTKIVNAANISDLESGALSLMKGSFQREEEALQPYSASLPRQNTLSSVNEVDTEETEELLRQPEEFVKKGSFSSGIIEILFI